MAAKTMIGLDQARSTVLDSVAPLGTEAVPLDRALGRRPAEPVRSTEAVPGFDNSAMDGFAVRAADTAGAGPGSPTALELVGESRAGGPATVGIGAGQAIAISTGAVMPDGADAVVRVEDTRRDNERDKGVEGQADGGRVEIGVEVPAGRNVRRAGDDIPAGSEVVGQGALIDPATLGVMASVGAATVGCFRRPRVALVSSGDELIGPDEPMRPGAVRNSNSFSISGLITESGAEVVSNQIARDRPEATRDAIESALSADLVVICGGVSVGEHDHVKAALAGLRVEQRFWRIALKPGKPTWFGVRGETPVFGLPGNPVSAMVTFLLLVRPALVALGGGHPDQRRVGARLTVECRRTPGRTDAVRCRMRPTGSGWDAEPTGPQGSHVLTSMLGASGLALLPPGDGSVKAGGTVEVELIGPG